MANALEYLIKARDKTSEALNSAKRGLADLADASGKAQGSTERFLKLSPQMMAMGAAVAGVSAAFYGAYQASGNMQQAAGKLGDSWSVLTANIANTEVWRKAAEGVDWLAGKLMAFADWIGGTTDQSQRQMSSREWDEILKKSEQNFESLKKAEKQSEELKVKVAKDRTSEAEKSRAEYQKIWEGTLSDEKKLALEYNRDVNAAVAYMQTQPKEREAVIATLLQLEQSYQDKLKGIREKNEFGPQAPSRDVLEQNIKDLESPYGPPMPDQDVLEERRTILRDALEKEYEDAASMGDMMVAQWAGIERKKTGDTEKETRERERIQASVLRSTSSIFGSLAALADGHGKKAFKRSQKLARAQATVDSISAAISAAKDTPGGPWAKFAAYAAVALNFGARMKAINSTSYEGGGGDVVGGGGSGPAIGTNATTTPNNIPISGQPTQQTQIQVFVNGALTPAQLVDDYIIPIVHDKIENNELVLGSRTSRMAIEYRQAAA